MKGDILALILVPIMLVFIAFAVIIGYLLSDQFMTGLQESGALEGTNIGYGVGQARYATTSFNYGFIFLLIILGVIMFTLGMLIPSHPIFIVPFILLWILSAFFGGYLSNMYYDFVSSTAEFAFAETTFSVMHRIMINLPFWISLLAMFTLIASYGISRKFGGIESV